MLIDEVILAIKLNASMLFAESIYEHVAKYVEINYCIVQHVLLLTGHDRLG